MFLNQLDERYMELRHTENYNHKSLECTELEVVRYAGTSKLST